MIPKVAKGGWSFKGAGLYYLHDKGHANTKDRVAFTHTENLPTRDPDRAIKYMAWTANNAQHLRLHNGGKPFSNVDYPVYSYSLAWLPGQDPTKDQMIEAAKDSLKMLGLGEHEALFVAHNDTEHPHIHVIANRVHPVTGITQGVFGDYKRFSRWAQAYELKWGKILCEQRVENNRRRDAGEYVKYDGNKSRDEAFSDWRRKRANDAFKNRTKEMSGQRVQHFNERKELYNAKEKKMADQRAQNREDARPEWKALFAQQRAERNNLRRLQQTAADKLHRTFRETELDRPGERQLRRLYGARSPQPVPGPLRAPKGRRASEAEKKQGRSAIGKPTGPVRAGDWLRAEKEERSGYLTEAFQLSSLWAIELAERHKKQRADLAAQLKKENAPKLGVIKGKYLVELDTVRRRQRQEALEQKERHLAERKQAELERKQGRDEKKFQAEQREKLQRALDQTKQDIQRRGPRLLERIKKAVGLADTRAREAADNAKSGQKPPSRSTEFKEQAKDTTERPAGDRGGSKSQPEQHREDKTRSFKDNARDLGLPGRGPAEKAKSERSPPSRSEEFKEQAKDTTRPPAKDREGPKTKAEQFWEAQEKGTPKQRREEKSRKLRENEEDLSQGRGRERSRTRKPPGSKPD
jgi:hypothetical protein